MSWSRNGLARKSTAPAFIARTVIGNVAVPGHEHDGQVDALRGQLALQIQPADPRQAHVQHDAARHVRQHRLQQLRRRAQHAGLQPHRTQQAVQRVAHGGIVIDHHDQWR